MTPENLDLLEWWLTTSSVVWRCPRTGDVHLCLEVVQYPPLYEPRMVLQSSRHPTIDLWEVDLEEFRFLAPLQTITAVDKRHEEAYNAALQTVAKQEELRHENQSIQSPETSPIRKTEETLCAANAMDGRLLGEYGLAPPERNSHGRPGKLQGQFSELVAYVESD